MKTSDFENQVNERVEQLEARISQLEAALKNAVTFEKLITRLLAIQKLRR